MDFLYFLPKELILTIISATPFLELRGAIPFGVSWGFAPLKVLSICVLGSTLPSPFLIVFFRKILVFLEKYETLGPFGNYLQSRALRKSARIKKYRLLGLFMLVAIPIPTTGAWTGSMVASLLDIRLKSALPAILLGNIAAGVIVLMLSHQILL
ncbi:Uncharacterized membrane protein [Peptoclostridium litorale DSM 5388]|uniref:Putative small multi-drug export n=1 Tax=Peptoclostridium litorale DSM 5388 TaxID=1121324 RepID=A0A069RDA6_PEPLI|nr:small multi-drug export protein [Peptoclostridium litorale]KDR94748.1 putative small multi-drug export [Peptoclostridium litorale DSM 5388]SIN91815.1 Uncharacterized membrane protein [Peptoclostridium litorale DSM 5388]